MNSDNLLLVDIGNTNLKWASLQNGHISAVASEPHKGSEPEQLAERCWSGTAAPTGVYMANVAGEELGRALSAWMAFNWQVEPNWVCAEASRYGVTNAYHNPGQLGVDRWLTLVAVRAAESEAVCIVDCGTAITIDLMTAEGLHRGGMILPGLNLMRESLLRDTKIPRVDSVAIDNLFARDTATAVASAALNAAAALIERSMQEAVSAYKVRPKLILTGSDAEIIAAGLTLPSVLDTGLVMKGLAVVAEAEGVQG
ncbi:MAG: type III pantothenate kinase [Sedimenticola sp.]|nr:type III pantothenate kinase [Sedimenticola sp.]